jgi:hypothetical protein
MSHATSPQAVASVGGGGPRGLDALPLLLHMLGFYLAFPLILPGGIEFPMAMSLLTVPLLLTLNSTAVRVQHVAWLLGLAGIAALTLLFAPQPGAFLMPRLRGLVLWVYSLVCAYALILELRRWPRERLARLMLGFSLVLITGCVLEIAGLLRPVSNAFRDLAFPAGAVSFRARDLEIAGFERPSLFTSEPSDVAKFLLLTSFGYVAASTHRLRHLVGLALCIAATTLTRSPIAILLLPLQALLMLLGRPLVRMPRVVSRPMTWVALLLAAVLATGFAASMLAGRIQQAVEGRDASSTVRLAVPVVTAWETLQVSPWWGAGISGTESIEDSIVLGFELVGIAALADPQAMNSETTLSNLIGNAFWLHWINLGLFGGTIAIGLLAGLMHSLGVRRRLLAFATIFVFAQTMGGAHAPYFWSFVAMAIGLAWQVDSTGLLELRRSRPVEEAVGLQQPAGSGV